MCQHRAAVEVRGQELRPEKNRAITTAQRLGRLLQGKQRCGALGVRRRIVGRERDGSVVALEGLALTIQALQRVGAVAVRLAGAAPAAAAAQ